MSQSTRLTDGQTEFSSQDRICIPCSAVKMGGVGLAMRRQTTCRQGCGVRVVVPRLHDITVSSGVLCNFVAVNLTLVQFSLQLKLFVRDCAPFI